MATSGQPRCRASRSDGGPCQANAGPGGWCFFHDPARADERERSRRAGGEARRARKPAGPPAAPGTVPGVALDTAEDLKAFVAEAMNAVRQGAMDVKVANSLAILGTLLLRIIDTTEIDRDMQTFKEELQRRAA